MAEKRYAPVLITTLNRYEHFKRCVESLNRNTHADKTELIIGLDFPPSEKYKGGYNKIVEYIPTITGFRNVTVLKRDINMGALNNWIDLRRYAFERYDTIIMTEDDNVFSPNFLDYMNQGLELYSKDPRVSSICAYSFPHSYRKCGRSVYFRAIVSAWGLGLWKTKEKQIVCSLSSDYQQSVLKSWKKSLKILFTNPMELTMLMSMINKKTTWGDVSRTAINIVNKQYQLCPVLSLVRNVGHDGSGEHCSDGGSEDIYAQQIIDDAQTFVYTEPYSPTSLANRYYVFSCMMPVGFLKKVIILFINLYKYIKWRFFKSKELYE